MSERAYRPQEIEPKWRQRWEEQQLYRTSTDASKPKYYVLEMLPYPSGTLHMGHVRNYSIGDALARYKRMQGFRVLHPMGWDSFGLPAENAAIKNKRDPGEWTRGNIANMKSQLRSFSFSYDWEREISSCEAEYYRWNQWFFIQMFNRGLAYRKKSQVNWCPECATVLANEQVVNGCCWRHETTPVEQKELDQWFFKTTAYVEELLQDLDELEGGWRVWFGPLPLASLDARPMHKANKKSGGAQRGRWKAQFLDGSGRPTGSRRRPKNQKGEGREDKPSP